MQPSDRWSPLAVGGLFILFTITAILNAGGYRHGVSDQAFYIPAILRHLDPALFPRDWAMLGAQDKFNVFTPILGSFVRVSGIPLPHLFLGLYLLGLCALCGAALGIGARLYRSRWTVIALAAALTLRHAVAMGAVNTLEGYLHPRMLAFGAGALAVAACLGGRAPRALLLVAAAIALHPTTGAWFALWIGVALAIADRRFTHPALALGATTTAAGAWAVLAGPLSGRFTRMDDVWLSVLGSKTYLFPSEWPLGGWLPVVFTALVATWVYAVRRRQGLVTDAERGVAAGAAVLFAAFLFSIPFTAARIALAVQLQVPRTLWMVDLLAMVYAVWYLAESQPPAAGRQPRAERSAPATPPGTAPRERRPLVVALVVVALALARGGYALFVEHPERALVQVDLPRNEWTDAMRWITDNTPKDAWVLAASGHAWRYGTSVRVAAARDVYLEEAKDTAMSMYSRDAAMTVLERIRRMQGFDAMTVERLRGLGPDVLVIERQDLGLPVLYRNARFTVHSLR